MAVRAGAASFAGVEHESERAMQQAPTDLTPLTALEHQEAHRFGRTVLRAGMVTLGAHVLSQVVRLCGNLILTRLLVPEAFGVMLVAGVVLIGLTLLTDVGLRQVVVRSPRAGRPDFLNTVWTLQILQGCFIAAVLLVASGAIPVAARMGWIPAGSTLASPDVPWVMGWMSVTALLIAFESTKMHMAIRNLQLGRLAIIDLGAQLAALGVMLAWVRISPGVGALVAGAWAAAACRTLATHLVLEGQPNRLQYDGAAAREVLSFGAPILLTSCLGFAVAHGDKLLLGGLLSAKAMGSYAIGFLLVAAFHDVLTRLLAHVAYPAISGAVARDPGALRASYLRMRSNIDMACLIGAGLLASCGDVIVALLYDARYSDAGTYLRILALSLLGLRYRVLSQVFLVIGRPRLLLYEQVTHAVCLVPAIFIGLRIHGVIGAVWGVALSYVLAQFWNVFHLQRKLGLFSAEVEWQGVLVFAAAAGTGMVARLWI
ncbi:MAG TPA: oligosaccharide flippase family protein [Ramlibacter sp.]|nr:oligosaccharide flippase family protein [Ramlibacter sp.]